MPTLDSSTEFIRLRTDDVRTPSTYRNRKVLRILGTRGVPAMYGGFETFAERLALHLVAHGWRVVVYCQDQGSGKPYDDVWEGIERVHFPVEGDGPAGTVAFDLAATRHASRHKDLCLTLGYNTAVFSVLLRVKGIPNLINMDGIEWSRAKWGPAAKTWFWLNDWAGCWLGNHLIADHPEIRKHLMTRAPGRKITMIPYGADRIDDAPVEPVLALGLKPGRYLTLIARPEPENSILTVIKAFSRERRDVQLVVLGHYDPDHNPFHRKVIDAASDEVRFVGAIYDKTIVGALRFHNLAYIHGHQVGGTNPSLVEALGAGNAVMAHDNIFNRWVAGPDAAYFANADECAERFDQILGDPTRLAVMRVGSRARFSAAFSWPGVLAEYVQLLERFVPAREQVAFG